MLNVPAIALYNPIISVLLTFKLKKFIYGQYLSHPDQFSTLKII
ncbi:hypothetical protein MuYL_1640 [Mucilaginibacter xinganensis]|uniref:Uncharacterized protein n=1 Tax=Mucilaginibacter xinganensis TaxID=1234841 RepID=A0A223NV87_9SPHI|nr:hypothetical protein MuYL_1640 [Mucilaginibacter xinganensis]